MWNLVIIKLLKIYEKGNWNEDNIGDNDNINEIEIVENNTIIIIILNIYKSFLF